MKLKREGSKSQLVATVRVGETEQEVTLDVPSTLTVLTAEELREQFVPKKDMNRRLGSAKSNAIVAALDDEEFKAKALAHWGVDPTKTGGTGEAPDFAQRITQERQQWEAKHLTPAQQRIKELEAEVNTVRQEGLEAAILRAGTGILQDYLLKAPPGVKGGKAPIVNMIGQYFGFDPESRSWLVRDGDSFAISSAPSPERTYKDVAEFIEEFATANPGLGLDKRQRGPGAQGAGDPTPKDIVSQIAALDAAGKYEEANVLRAQQLEQMR